MLTPLEIEQKTFKKRAVGYSSKEVNDYLKEIVKDYETLYRENIEIKDKMTVLNEAIQYYKTLENTIQNTLVTAEKSATDTKNAANSKADAIENEAQAKALKIINEAQQKVFEINQKFNELNNKYHLAKDHLESFYKTQIKAINDFNVIENDNTVKLESITNSKDEINTMLRNTVAEDDKQTLAIG